MSTYSEMFKRLEQRIYALYRFIIVAFVENCREKWWIHWWQNHYKNHEFLDKTSVMTSFISTMSQPPWIAEPSSKYPPTCYIQICKKKKQVLRVFKAFWRRETIKIASGLFLCVCKWCLKWLLTSVALFYGQGLKNTRSTNRGHRCYRCSTTQPRACSLPSAVCSSQASSTSQLISRCAHSTANTWIINKYHFANCQSMKEGL